MVPLMSMARLAESEESGAIMRLLVCSKGYGTVIYRDEIARLGATGWFDCTHTFTRSPRDIRASFHRRIDRLMLETWIAAGPFPRLAYIRGPPTMVEISAADLGALGMGPSKVKTEKYD